MINNNIIKKIKKNFVLKFKNDQIYLIKSNKFHLKINFNLKKNQLHQILDN